jgi:hypothetical protein
VIAFYKNDGSLAAEAIMTVKDWKGNVVSDIPFCDCLLLSVCPTSGKAEGGRGNTIDRDKAIKVSFEAVSAADARDWIFDALKAGATKDSVPDKRFHRVLSVIREGKKVELTKILTLGVGNVSDKTRKNTFRASISQKVGEKEDKLSLFLDYSELWLLGKFFDTGIDMLIKKEFTMYKKVAVASEPDSREMEE